MNELLNNKTSLTKNPNREILCGTCGINLNEYGKSCICEKDPSSLNYQEDISNIIDQAEERIIKKILIAAILSIITALIPVFITPVMGTTIYGFGFGVILSAGLVNNVVYVGDFTTWAFIFFSVAGIEQMFTCCIKVNAGKSEPKNGGIRAIVGGVFVIIAPIIFIILNLELLELGFISYVGWFNTILPGIISIYGGIQMIKM